MRYGRSQCPLTRYHSYNYHQLQDMAREIPEEPCMADSENDGNNCQRSGPVNYSGACGDNDVIKLIYRSCNLNLFAKI